MFGARLTAHYALIHDAAHAPFPIVASLFSEDELDKLLRKWYGGKIDRDTIPDELFQETFKKLSGGVSEGYQTEFDDDDIRLLLELKSNVATFSAFKAHSNSLELFDALTDENGKKRSWAEFRKAAGEIDTKYNQLWLEAEYNLAVRQGRSAVMWQEFQRSKDVYPNIEYMPSRSANPSKEHQQYYGLIAHIDDPIWDTLSPPSRWNCQCWQKQTRAEVNKGDIEAPEPVRGIAGNAGKSGQVFSADHPFVDNLVAEEKARVKQELGRLRDLNTEIIRMKVGKQSLLIHVNADHEDLADNLIFARAIAGKLKKNISLNAHSTQPGVKNPELAIGNVIGDRYAVKGDNIRRSVSSAFDAKVGKGGQLRDLNSCWMGIDFQGKLNLENLEGAMSQLKGKLNSYPKVKFVVLKNGPHVLKIDNKRTMTMELILKSAKAELLP